MSVPSSETEISVGIEVGAGRSENQVFLASDMIDDGLAGQGRSRGIRKARNEAVKLD